VDFNYHHVLEKFTALYGKQPLLVRAPGRINLIGEHTDYNDGFVMPAAINHATVFGLAPSDNGKSVIYSLKYDEFFEVDLANPQRVESPKWVNYLLGVIRHLVDDGHTLKPFNCVFGGDVPMGAGLSSSASMECGFAFALNELNQLNVPKEKLILIAQWSEHNYVGVKCGIMDQFASMMGADGKVILLDCRSLEYRYSPLDIKDYDIVLCDTKVKHSLVDSEYNTRRNECEQGVAILQKHYPAVKSLRDASVEQVERHRDEMPGKVYDRCLYVVQEIQRTQEASRDLDRNDLKAFGGKMYATHEGLSKLYQVSCPELDFLVEQARAYGSIPGARMMGGGFGGCTINLVPKKSTNDFLTVAGKAYREKFGHDMGSYVVAVKDGTGIVDQSVENITLP